MTTQTPPSGTPAAEIAVDAALAGRLLAAQHPDLADRPIRFLASGWDNAIFRLGDDLLLRLPQRAVGARLIAHEQRWLPVLKDRLPLDIPAPVRIGEPGEGFPWPWSITPWLEGETADLAPPDDDQGEALAGFFRALHVPAPDAAPHNPLRGVPLAERAFVFDDRLRKLSGRTDLVTPAIHAIWADALAAPDDAAPTWIQGDPHPRNVLVRGGRLSAVIDWGDMARGDRASDLAAVWMLLPRARTRTRAVAALPEVSAATWRRARGWAVLYGLMLLDAGLADDPRMAAIGAWTLERLQDGP
ncbi:aminoglycoside phosphotransferase family protein [Caulobacter sp. KR2-114]|uniref:aminoglycoside phosphotransferase family protein n=1 Tax=Caulobacter sp. KR2-114 TaxID=3400912 RepID=UPI003C098205